MKDFETGEILDGRYEVLGLLGKGGMGRVYRARQINLDRSVAIKVPSEAVLNNDEYIERFLREAQTCARIAHDNIVAIYDVHEGPMPYIVMEFVDGMQLNHYLHERSRVLSVADLAEMSRQMSEGLHAAHSRGIVHRDIKPANIFITRESQRVKIMDFGIARVEGLTSLTMTGAMMGTPFYMAPEQIRGGEVTAATDIYALACLVYQLFTGVLVFDGKLPELIFKHVNEEPTPPSGVNPRLPRTFDDVVLKGLCKDPESRYQSAREFHAEMTESLRPIVDWSLASLLGKTGADGGEPLRLPRPSGGKRPTPPVVGPTELLMPGSEKLRPSEAAGAGAATPPSPAPGGAGGRAAAGQAAHATPTARQPVVRPWFWAAGAAICVVLVLSFVWWQASRVASPAPIRLSWVPQDSAQFAPRQSYRPGEYITVWVASNPPASPLSPRVYSVSIAQAAGGKVVYPRTKTLQDRIAIRVDPSWPLGEYRLAVALDGDTGDSSEPLETSFVIAER